MMIVPKEIGQRLTAWWLNEPQDRPCILLTLAGQPAPRDNFNDRQWWSSPKLMLASWLWSMAHTEYYGEAFPYHYADMGASAVAAALGAEPIPHGRETLWVKTCVQSASELSQITDLGNSFIRLMEDYLRLSVSKSAGRWLVAPWCLGAPSDTAAALVGTENLLLEMAQNPDDVDRALERMREVWTREFEATCAIIESGGLHEMTGWFGIWAPGRTAPIQDDFSCMISPGMFRRFSLPYTEYFASIMPWAFYHLDGPGALTHLSDLCGVAGLKAIQWQPGAGQDSILSWKDVLRKILASGKSTQVYTSCGEIEPLEREVGSKGLLTICSTNDRQEAEALALCYRLERYENPHRKEYMELYRQIMESTGIH